MSSLSLTYTVPAGAIVGFIFTSSTNITINWNDGSPLDSVPDTASNSYRFINPHTYTTAGTYTILISGEFLNSLGIPNPNLPQQGIEYLISVNSFGNLGITSLAGAFLNATTLTSVPTTLPSTVTKLNRMFYNATVFNSDIRNWDTSNVTDMSEMFYTATAFNSNISTWDVSKVTNMSNMFNTASAFNNGGVDLGWTTIGTPGSQVNMSYMFNNAQAFNANISTWDVSNVTNMSYMFQSAIAFNQNLTGWNMKLTKVSNMSNMFDNATAFNNGGVALGWTTIGTLGTPVDMSYMFSVTQVFNADISTWVTTNVTNMSGMFFLTQAFNKDISSWDVGNVTDMSSMFNNAQAFNKDISSWDVGNVTNMSGMFQSARVFNQNLSSWNNNNGLSKITSMSNMFQTTSAFNNGGAALTWTTIGTSATPVNMSFMFEGAQTFNADISSWVTSNVNNMYSMFFVAPLFNQDLSSWDVSNVTNMTRMFPNSGLLTDNFDNMVNAWSLQSVRTSVTLNALTRSSYSNSGYDTLTGTYNWQITAEPVTYNPTNIIPGETTTFTYTNSNKRTVNGSDYGLYYNYGSGDFLLRSFTASSASSSYTFNNVTPLIGGTDIFTIKNITTSTVIDSVNVSVRDPIILKYTLPIEVTENEIVSFYLGNATNITIDWGDGSRTGPILNDQIVEYQHNYSTGVYTPGECTITISGTSLGSFSASQGIQYLTSVDTFGDLEITSLAGAFQNASSNFSVPSTLPTTVTDMSDMFTNATLFNQDLSTWNVSNVTNMISMFEYAESFNNGDQPLAWINNATASSVNMGYMFYGATAFNQDLSTWDVSNVTDMEGMFIGSGLVTDNFDNMLNAWASQTVRSYVTLEAPTRSLYSDSAVGILTSSTKNWTINVTEVTYANDFASGYNSTFTYTNVEKPALSGSTYQLLYGSTLLSTFVPSTSGNTYTFDNVVITTTGLLVFTIQKVIFNNARSRIQNFSETYELIDNVYVTVNTICFKEGSKILCFKNNVEKYVPIENVRKGDLVKTRLNGYVPVHMIGKSQMYHKKTDERRKEQLYTCSKEKFEEVFEDLVITGCHSILIDEFTNDKQREKAIEINSGRLCVTDKKYRLPACVDDRASVYDKEGLYTIYHLALENDDYYMNYGIYANGLLVETSSKRYLKELSGMELID